MSDHFVAGLIAAHIAQAFYSFTYHLIKIILMAIIIIITIVIILYNKKNSSLIYTFVSLKLLDSSDSC